MRMENIPQVADCFQLLSTAIRLRMLCELAAQPLGIDELQHRCGTTRNNVAKHLQVCLKAGAVARQTGRERHLYELRQPWLAHFIREVLSSYSEKK